MTNKQYKITVVLFMFTIFNSGDFTSETSYQSNGNFTLQPNIQGSPEEILWKLNNDKVVEFDQNELQEYRQFKGRTILNITTGALTLTHLRESDSGEYVGELQVKGLLTYHTQRVKVLDAVGEPTVTCQVNRTSVTLLCSGDHRPATQYRWEGPAIEPQPGPQLKIEAAESSDSVYTCVLNNSVSESRGDFPVKSCFPAPVSSSVIIPVVIVLIVLIIPIIAGIIYYKKCYKKKRNFKKDPESGTNVKERVKRIEDMMSPAKSQNKFQKAALTKQHRGADGIAGVPQEESPTDQRQPLLQKDTENYERTPVKERVKGYKDMTSPAKTHDEHQKAALIEQHRGADGIAGVPQEQSQTESLNQGEDSVERGVKTEGGNSPKHPSSGTVPLSSPVSPSAAPPKTANEEDTTHTPSAAPPKTGNEEDTTHTTSAAPPKTGNEEDTTHTPSAPPPKTGNEEDTTHTPSNAPPKTGNEEDTTHTPSAAPPKTGSEEDTTHTPSAPPPKTGSEEDTTHTPSATPPKAGNEEDTTHTPSTGPPKTGSEEDTTHTPSATPPKTGNEEDTTHTPSTAPPKTGNEEDTTHTPSATPPKAGNEEDTTHTPSATPPKAGNEEDTTHTPSTGPPKTGSEEDTTHTPSATPPKAGAPPSGARGGGGEPPPAGPAQDLSSEGGGAHRSPDERSGVPQEESPTDKRQTLSPEDTEHLEGTPVKERVKHPASEGKGGTQSRAGRSSTGKTPQGPKPPIAPKPPFTSQSPLSP